MSDLYPYPGFSFAESDRRWKAVRELMAQQGIDVIVTLNNTGNSTDFQADTRYLTHCGGGGDSGIAAVLPLEGEVTAIATSAKLRWPPVQDWTKDVREANRRYGQVVVERLKELNVERGRIGITGLGEEVFNRVCSSMKPGVSSKELAEITERAGKEAALTMHDRGAGDDGPIIIHNASSARQFSVELLENIAFICKPSVVLSEGNYKCTWGDTVVATAHGARRLGKRTHDLAVS